MAKAIYLDVFSGLSGNMLLGAFLAAGMDEHVLRRELAKLPVMQECELKVSQVRKNGIAATYVDVEVQESQTFPELREHDEHHQDHHHRAMRDIRAMIEGSSLSDGAKAISLRIFKVLAEAEGHVHGVPADEVTFHEVGAADSIVDICGVAICLDVLGITEVYAGRVNVGSGFVRCAHGTMPVPAPAVAELLKDWPTYAAGAPVELTTPTGAAVVRAFANISLVRPASFRAVAIGYGAGTRDNEGLPNVLRLYLGEMEEQQKPDDGSAEDKYILAANIDDMTPQIYGYLFDKLLAAGALDVWVTPIYMKKNRPAHELSVLVTGAQRAICQKILFRETTTIGLRVTKVDERVECDRRVAQAETKYGTVRVKIAAYEGEIVNVQPEFEDCRACAEAHDVPWKRVREAALREIAFRLGDA
ncbi:nickel pincer cofactor biosynthesis protein LarC [uncultured Selenomonas sp.]|uniref:nickel pincer cofactor biosynthesis protein LarC n=1 Tax=uncultured Selenomonas sp. TaxID=159275 RepID=UPI0025FA0B52|nr:nickel pincer cofactor biosynthesis protein LarC [uncultured Selenomonas sp.]